MAIAIVRTGDDREHKGGVGDGACHRTDVLERFPTRHARIAFIFYSGIQGHAAHGGFHAVKTRMGAWYAHRSTAVTADRKRTHTARDRSSRSGAGPAGGQIGVPWIARRWKNRVVTDAAVTKLGHVGFSEDHRARVLETLHHDVIFVWNEVSVCPGAGNGFDAFGAD